MAGRCGDQGFFVATARVLKRAWQIYVAHVFLFAIYLAEIAYVSQISTIRSIPKRWASWIF